MAAINEITSYLVGLGFDVDQSSYSKFKDAIGAAQSKTEYSVKNITESILKFQISTTAAFESVGAGLIGTALHFADADQKARLFGERMFMSTGAARSLQVSLSTLNASVEDITWDRELHDRFITLQNLQRQMALSLGTGEQYEQTTKYIRDVRFEFQKFQVELTYIGQAALQNIFKAFGSSSDDFLTKLEKINSWIAEHLPEIGQKVADYIVPVIKEIIQISKELVPLLENMALVFTNLIGILSGDSSLEGTSFTFEKIGRSIEKVVGVLGTFLHFIVLAEELVAHLALGIESAFEGNFKAASAQFKQALSDLTAGSAAVLGTIGGTALGSAVGGAAGLAIGGPVGALLGTSLGAAGGGVGGAIGGLVLGHLNSHGVGEPTYHDPFQKKAGSDKSVNEIKDMIRAAARKYGLPEDLALAQAYAESRFKQFSNKSSDGLLTSSANAKGIFQLEPNTAKGLGVDYSDTAQNIDGGTRYLASLIKQYHGDTTKALEAYNLGPGALNKLTRAHKSIPIDVQRYAAGIQNRATHVTVNVNVAQTNANPNEIARVAAQHVNAAVSNQTLNNLVTQQGVYR